MLGMGSSLQCGAAVSVGRGPPGIGAEAHWVQWGFAVGGVGPQQPMSNNLGLWGRAGTELGIQVREQATPTQTCAPNSGARPAGGGDSFLSVLEAKNPVRDFP